MTESLERELKIMFAEDAERAPAAVALAEQARRRVRQRRQSRLGWGAGVLVAASVAAVAGLGTGPLSDPPPREPAAIRSPGSQLTGALPMSDAGSCPYGYSPRALAERAFAFDGTVVSLGPSHSDRPRSVLHHAGVTFAVNEWFAGGSGPTAAVDMPNPNQWSEDGLTAYGIGTRLLVSGNTRRGSTTMADATAGYCGFTRYYDPSTADIWREVTR